MWLRPLCRAHPFVIHFQPWPENASDSESGKAPKSRGSASGACSSTSHTSHTSRMPHSPDSRISNFEVSLPRNCSDAKDCRGEVGISKSSSLFDSRTFALIILFLGPDLDTFVIPLTDLFSTTTVHHNPDTVHDTTGLAQFSSAH